MTSSRTPDTGALWTAVDALTKPTSKRVERGDLEAEFWLRGPEQRPVMCSVSDYRAAVVNHGEIPSLWEQAEEALATGREQADGGGSLKAARSPADLDLMEIILTIRESMSWQLPGRGITPRATMTLQMRQLAAHIVTHEPQNVDWWTYRFSQWARLLNVYLRALEPAPKAVRLRGLPCPECKAVRITSQEDHEDEPTVKPAIRIDFVNGTIRAAQCSACAAAWWRGDDLWALAKSQAYDTPTTGDVADTA